MQNLKFNRLLILSNSAKSANQFVFKNHLNLITAKDNSVGKSTLAKLLLWGLGCEPSLDTTWLGLDCSTLLEFSINKTQYKVKRYRDSISLKERDLPYVEYSKITGAYSQKFAEIVGFKALLPHRTTGLLEVPPPAYYFIPFYIDQKKSWAKAWDNFEKLEQYQSWKSIIIKYHIGLLTAEHFEIEAEKGEKKDTQKSLNREVEKISTTLEVLEEYIPKINLTSTSQQKFEKLTFEIKFDLSQLQEKQERLLDQFTHLQTEKVYLQQQKLLSEKIISELDKDYIFSIENIEGEDLECPLCGTVHENSIVNRTSIMTDKSQAENQYSTIVGDLAKIERKILNLDDDLDDIKDRISVINEKYIIEEEDQTIDLPKFLESISSTAIKENVTTEKNAKVVKATSIYNEIKSLNKEQKKLLTTEQIDESDSEFIARFSKYIRLLDAQAVNLSAINSPTDYGKVIKEGGAAEGARAILAYYLTIFSMVEKFADEVIAPLVIDTPNQQEQSFTNYEKIVDILTTQIDLGNQVILCAMENTQIQPFKKIANVITLNDGKLLNKEKFDAIKLEFDSI